MTAGTDVLLTAGTAAIADVFDALNLQPPVLDTALAPIVCSAVRFAGPAYTVEGRSERWRGGGDRAKLAAIDAMPAGVVPVWAGADIRGVCCFGDLLAEAMKAHGVAGVVVDGGIRDVSFLRTLDLPLLARYRTPAQAIGRWRVTGHQVPVRVRGAVEEEILVHPGDTVVADDDGVIVVPQAMLAQIVARLGTLTREEARARAEIRQGLPLLAALEKYGHL